MGCYAGPEQGPVSPSAGWAHDPATWPALAYANSPVITQVDDGHPIGPGLTGNEISSSASKPTVVAQMLTALQAEPGMSVLKIGTGTGYRAALLAHRLGGQNVTSIEINAAVAAPARKALTAAACGDVTVVTGDGAAGYPPRAQGSRSPATPRADSASRASRPAHSYPKPKVFVVSPGNSGMPHLQPPGARCLPGLVRTLRSWRLVRSAVFV